MGALLPVILNLSSGNSDDAETTEKVREAFRAAGARAEIQGAASGEEVVRLTRAAAAGAGEVVVAGGGDGTLSSVASVLAGTGKALGIVPLGTFNHFARDLGIPLGTDDAARNVLEGRVVAVDVGEVNGRVFVNNSSLGLYPRIVRHREEQRQRLGWGKWPAFLWATLHALHRHRMIDVVLEVDGKEARRRTPFVFVGNNVYSMEGLDVGTRETLDRGELSLYLAPFARPFDMLRFALRALFGRLRGTKGFEALRARQLEIETAGPQARVATDGELTMLDTPLRYRIRPSALRVVVPRDRGREEGA